MDAAHETAGVLRMIRSGLSVPQTMRMLGISKEQLEHEMKVGLDDEAEARRLGLDIYDGKATIGEKNVPAKGKTPVRVSIYIRAKYIKPGDEISNIGVVAKVMHLNKDVAIKLESGEEIVFRQLDEIIVRRLPG